MKNIKALFRKAAEPVVDYVMRHAMWFASRGYFIGNGIMFVKDNTVISFSPFSIGASKNLAPTFDTAAGVIFLFSGASLFLVKRFPRAAYIAAGSTCVLASGCLFLSALHIFDPNAVNYVKIVGAVAQSGTGALVWAHAPLERMSQMPLPKEGIARKFRKMLQPTFDRPLRSSAISDLASGGQLAWGGFVDGDKGMIAAMCFWLLGAGGLGLSDNKTQYGYWIKQLKAAYAAQGIDLFSGPAHARRTSHKTSPVRPR